MLFFKLDKICHVFDMKSEWEVVERVNILRSVETLQVVKKSFFIAQVEVVLKFVVHANYGTFLRVCLDNRCYGR